MVRGNLWHVDANLIMNKECNKLHNSGFVHIAVKFVYGCMYVSIERKNRVIPVVSRKWCVNGNNLNLVFEIASLYVALNIFLITGEAKSTLLFLNLQLLC